MARVALTLAEDRAFKAFSSLLLVPQQNLRALTANSRDER